MAAQTEVKSAKGEKIISETRPEIEIPKEVRQVGVEARGTLELPPDVKKLGVTPSGPQTPVSATPLTFSLPISDDKILVGIHAPITSALKWLAVWCIKKLRAAHLILKNVHGRIVRVMIR